MKLLKMCSTTVIKGEKASKSTEEDAEANFRIYGIISYFVVLVVIGLPIWWYTTRVYRATLPLVQMQDVELKNTQNDYGMPLSLEYDILVSFVHPDPFNPTIDLRGVEIEEHLRPFLDKISPVSDFIVKSQWLFLLDLGVTPSKTEQYLVLKEEQLPHIITPLESKLWSHISPRPTINLVLYFARCDDLPLYIFGSDDKKVESNAFLSARWGGFYIINADKTSCEKGVFKPDVNAVTSTFITHIQRLFKIDNITDTDNIYELKMRKATEMVDSTKRTLKSLAGLLSEIKSIVISDDVGNKIRVAVENADLAQKFLAQGDVDEGLKFAKIAFSHSERAFSDPSLLSLLYFPEDQKYAVYIPLFLPIMIPVIMSLSTLRKWIMVRKKKID
ncbi:GPI transamidase component PIG-S isoform X2 [Diorhabda sublineata]|uniref:GPI transamidase component PIG-S isoform X2 n=1 Tax=Diorhabda sublineata TaxID=1163346 RepID=UPI0024E1281F|nr:GPI transamidase component PIG-S isoform X2 [Diorhabda sublineata]